MVLNEKRFRSRTAPADQGAEQAKVQLRGGIARTQEIVADYRRQLTRLARGCPGDQPLFRWPRD